MKLSSPIYYCPPPDFGVSVRLSSRRSLSRTMAERSISGKQGAGILLVEEAGGKVSKMDGNKFSIYNKEIVASNGHIHKDMIKFLT